jgi:ESF2/ABP1 family protein
VSTALVAQMRVVSCNTHRIFLERCVVVNANLAISLAAGTFGCVHTGVCPSHRMGWTTNQSFQELCSFVLVIHFLSYSEYSGTRSSRLPVGITPLHLMAACFLKPIEYFQLDDERAATMKKSRQQKEDEEDSPVESDDDDDEEEEDDESQGEEDDDGNDELEVEPSPSEKKKIHKLSLTKTQDFNETLRKRGVVYIARIPPRMNPTKLKALLSDFGDVTRIYLVEEDASNRKRRRKNGGSGSKRYTEGWVEFGQKKIAKVVAQNLNNTPISNHKRDYHCGDLWNLKYLSKFQWSHLTEKVAYERRVREQKLRVEMMQAKRENASYTQLVETGKKLDQIENRKRKRLAKEGVVAGDSNVATGEHQTRRPPRQTKVLEEGKQSTKRAILSALV